MPTELEQKVIEYAAARNEIRDLIHATNGKGLEIKPEQVRRVRAAEEALIQAGEELATPSA